MLVHQRGWAEGLEADGDSCPALATDREGVQYEVGMSGGRDTRTRGGGGEAGGCRRLLAEEGSSGRLGQLGFGAGAAAKAEPPLVPGTPHTNCPVG